MPRLLGLVGRLPGPLLLLLFAATQAPGLSSAGDPSNVCCEQIVNGELVCLENHFKDQNFPERCHKCRRCKNDTEIRPCTNVSDTVCAGDTSSGTEAGAAGSGAITGSPGRMGSTWDAALTDSSEQSRSTNTTPTSGPYRTQLCSHPPCGDQSDAHPSESEGSGSGVCGSFLVLCILGPLAVLLIVILGAVCLWPRGRAYLFHTVRCLWRLLRRFLDQGNTHAEAARMLSGPPSRNTQDPATCPTPDPEEVIILSAHPPADQPDTELVPCVPGCMEQE